MSGDDLRALAQAARDKGYPSPRPGRAAFIAAANPTAVLALLDRVEAAEQRAEAAEAQVERVCAVVADAPALMLDGGYIDVFIPADNIRAALDGPA